MADPFRPNSKSQLIREAQIGLTVVAVLLVLLVYVAFNRISGRGRHLAGHFRDAPITKQIGPQDTQQSEQNSQAKIEIKPELVRGPLPGVAKRFSPKSSLTEGNYFAQERDPESRAQRQLNSQLADEQPGLASKLDLVELESGSNSKTRSTEVKSQPNDGQFQAVPVISPPLVGNTQKTQNSPQPIDDPFLDSKVANHFAKTNEIVKEGKRKLMSSETSGSERVTSNDFQFQSSPQELSERFGQQTAAPFASLPTKVKQRGQTLASSTGNGGVEKVSFTNELRSSPSIPKGPKRESEEDSAELHPSTGLLNPSLKRSADFQIEVSPIDINEEELQKYESDKFVASKPILRQPSRDSTKSFGKPLASKPPQLETVPTAQAEMRVTHTQSDSLEGYLVEDGDSYWSISQKVYEDGRFFRALYKHNESRTPEFDKLTPGTRILTPSINELIRVWPRLCPVPEASVFAIKSKAAANYYVTRAGDTLFGIAGAHLNQASRYLEVIQMNRDILGSVESTTPLQAGIKLELPKQ
ncbi:MAG: LysM peptidoglycan-binding domain-containing protein [Mariniblastus sp.]|nr:LysM peptidoglycan-binding domain-containing protein [Mariniblastus sp.]